jgi:GTP diphosphokinase / guanosine-3',5'-bis(diphosphate) 3'-diphosphatase
VGKAPSVRKLDDAIAHAVETAKTLAEVLHIDVVTLAAVLVYPTLQLGAATADEVRARLDGPFGEAMGGLISSLERFDVMRRPAEELRRTAMAEGGHDAISRERRKGVERRRAQDADAWRRMFLAMAEEPRVVIIKIADQLGLMRGVREAADLWLAHEGKVTSQPLDLDPDEPFVTPAWTQEDCRMHALDTREIFAPLAGRLGMGRVEGELEDLAFAVLEPEECRWLSEAVEAIAEVRQDYVNRVCAVLREEMTEIDIHAEVSGRVKHLYSIYGKVKRSGNRDLSTMYDILAFRIIVGTVAECYQALGHVHELWKPMDNRIKDFIANPKPNGYQSLHTTVFCLDNRLAEIQIRTREMHQIAEYGVAVHWYYKDAGDAATARARPVQAWVDHVKQWRKELQDAGSAEAAQAVDAVKGDALKQQIFVYTPAGDVKELPAGSTALDFAYRIHSDVGNHCAGIRVTAEGANGRMTRRMVPLDHTLRGGEVVEVLQRNDAHPTRDWLKFVTTKSARAHITRYLKEHERDIDLQIGRDQLDRELRLAGMRRGIEGLNEDELQELADALGLPDAGTIFVSLARGALRPSQVITKLRETVRPPVAEAAGQLEATGESTTAVTGASVGGLAGMLSRPAACCAPLPGDDLIGFVSRGRGVVIHRTDCPNAISLAAKEPQRVIAVEWPYNPNESLHAHIVVESTDRTGLVRDVSGAISNRKINMTQVKTVTNRKTDIAVIQAVLEIKSLAELESLLRELRGISGVISAERWTPRPRKLT